MQRGEGARGAPDVPARVWPALVVLGFTSGLPQPLVDSTLLAWLKTAGLTPGELLDAGYVTLPYTLKVLWAPLVDRYTPPWLGRRRGWILACQLAVALGIALLAGISPERTLGPFLAAATLVALAGATQDLVVNGYTCDALPSQRLAGGAGLLVWGYRGAWLVSGGLLLVLADQRGWRTAYLAMLVLFALGLVGTALAPEPARAARPSSLGAALVEPLVAWRAEHGARALVLLLVFALLYRLPDGIANTLAVPFLGDHYDLTRLGLARGAIGLAGAALGAVLAAWAMPRLGVRRALLLFGLLQAASNLGYVALELGWIGGLSGLVGLLLFENLCGALAATAFVAYLMGFCTSASSATQYALLTTITLLGPHLLREPLKGLQEVWGWNGFFLFSCLAILPVLLFARALPVPRAPQG